MAIFVLPPRTPLLGDQGLSELDGSRRGRREPATAVHTISGAEPNVLTGGPDRSIKRPPVWSWCPCPPGCVLSGLRDHESVDDRMSANGAVRPRVRPACLFARAAR